MFQVTDLTLSNSGLVEFSISTVTCSRAGAKETETARRCTLALGGWKREGNVTELQDSTSKEGNMVDTEGGKSEFRVKEDNEFTLASLELFHMKPGWVHSWHLPASHFRHGMLVSATIGSTKVTLNIQPRKNLSRQDL